VLLLLLGHLLFCWHTAFSKSITHDELWHLPVGARNLGEWRFDIEVLNPPVSRVWAAIPLVLGGAEISQTVKGTGVGGQFVQDHPQDFMTWYHWGRFFHLFWTLATATLVYCWARRLFGMNGALATLLLYVTCPNLIAHGSLVTPDTPSIFAFISTLFAFTFWCERPDWRRACLWGVLLGVAQGIKFTCLLLVPLLFAIAVVQLWGRRIAGLQWKQVGGQFAIGMGISLIVLGSCYGFQGLFVPLKDYTFRASELVTLQKVLEPVSQLPVPFPRDYILGIDEQRHVMSGQHPIFLDGRWSLQGFPDYFFKALLYKLPHVFQLLLVFSFISFCLGWSGPRRWRDVLTLLLPVALVLFITSGESLQLGVRYILPVIPLLMILAGSSFRVLDRASMKTRMVTGLFLVLFCGLSLRHHPHHLAYFNELAGGPIGGRQHLLDSNLDWGQDLHLLKKRLEERNWDQYRMAYFGSFSPEILGMSFTTPPSRRPEPGRYAVSVNYVMGRPHVLFQGDGTERGVDFQEFGYFRAFQPVETIGGSIDLYELSEEDVARWDASVRQFSSPVR